ncbi:hypothetical protein AALP_AAs74334U000100, partial [Arabis alpina]
KLDVNCGLSLGLGQKIKKDMRHIGSCLP